VVFKVEFDGEEIACTSARCIQRLLGQGWRLSDPSQTETLLQAIAAEEGLGEETEERRPELLLLHPR
jgi:hypothetical protein